MHGWTNTRASNIELDPKKRGEANKPNRQAGRSTDSRLDGRASGRMNNQCSQAKFLASEPAPGTLVTKDKHFYTKARPRGLAAAPKLL